MARFLTFLMIGVLLLGQGFSAGAAVCVHGSNRAHASALASRDGAVSAVAKDEDSAASLMSKKAAASANTGTNWVAHLSPSPALALPRATSHRIVPSLAEGPALEGISTAPLLRPPHALA